MGYVRSQCLCGTTFHFEGSDYLASMQHERFQRMHAECLHKNKQDSLIHSKADLLGSVEAVIGARRHGCSLIFYDDENQWKWHTTHLGEPESSDLLFYTQEEAYQNFCETYGLISAAFLLVINDTNHGGFNTVTDALRYIENEIENGDLDTIHAESLSIQILK